MGRVEITTGLNELFDASVANISKFNKKNYDDTFQMLCKQFYSTSEVLEQQWREIENPTEKMTLSRMLVQHSDDILNSMSKSKKKITMVDHNMAMVTFVIPVLMNKKSEVLEEFVDASIEEWNSMRKDTKIEKSTNERIASGFKNGLCYITTAVCDSLGKGDDCYELSTLRDYRDNYLLKMDTEGEALVKMYYNIAPTIVNKINRENSSEMIYNEIWLNYLHPCISYIEAGENELSKKIYSEMVHKLADKYLCS